MLGGLFVSDTQCFVTHASSQIVTTRHGGMIADVDLVIYRLCDGQAVFLNGQIKFFHFTSKGHFFDTIIIDGIFWHGKQTLNTIGLSACNYHDKTKNSSNHTKNEKSFRQFTHVYHLSFLF